MRRVSGWQILVVATTAASTFGGMPTIARAQSVPRSSTATAAVTAGGGEAAMPIATLRELVRVETLAGARLTGPLRAFTPAAVTIEQRPPYIFRALSPLPVPGPRVTVMRDSVRSTAVLRGPPWRNSAIAGGMLAGAALGAFLGARSVHNECAPEAIGCVVSDRSSGAVLGAMLGAGLGFTLAQITARKRWVPARLPPADPA